MYRKNEWGFTQLLMGLIICALLSATGLAFWIVYDAKNHTTTDATTTDSQKSTRFTSTTKAEAFDILSTTYKNMKPATECQYYSCKLYKLTRDQRSQVAIAYGVISKPTSDQDVFIGFIKGKSADVPGIGTGYIHSKEAMNLQDDRWYWEIGACSTNKRVYIDAESGEIGVLHSYTYCSDMQELDGSGQH